MNSLQRNVLRAAVCLPLVCLPVQVCGQISITFDYSLDTGGFFSDNARRTLLQSAANSLTSRLGDTLTAITPDGVNNTWSEVFNDPGTGSSTSLTGASIPANTLLIYVGARDLSGSTLGLGGPGGFSASGFQSFLDAVSKRGQTGATATDFGPWGGSISFDNATSWYFDSDPSTSDVPGGQSDFYSVALHEIGHVLGIGTATSWNNLVGSGLFTGANARAANGGVNVSLDPGNAHWLDGTMSVVPGTATPQEAAMDPSLTTGTRKLFTDLDYAGLSDVGWTVTPVPEPTALAFVFGTGLLIFAGLRKGQSRTTVNH